jgi:predicted nucleic acid-binding protein
MSNERILLDTVFIQALLNKRDQYYKRAIAFLPRMEKTREVWVTEAVLIEVADALSAMDRALAVGFIKRCYQAPNMRVVNADTALLNRALDLYEARPDKSWSLTDCISFVVMDENGIFSAVTADQHFSQAGYQVLLAQE